MPTWRSEVPPGDPGQASRAAGRAAHWVPRCCCCCSSERRGPGSHHPRPPCIRRGTNELHVSAVPVLAQPQSAPPWTPASLPAAFTGPSAPGSLSPHQSEAGTHGWHPAPNPREPPTPALKAPGPCPQVQGKTWIRAPASPRRSPPPSEITPPRALLPVGPVTYVPTSNLTAYQSRPTQSKRILKVLADLQRGRLEQCDCRASRF